MAIDRRPIFGFGGTGNPDTLTGRPPDFLTNGFASDFDKCKRAYELGYRRFLFFQPIGGLFNGGRYYPSAIWEALDQLQELVTEEENPNNINYKDDLVEKLSEFYDFVDQTDGDIEFSFYIGFRASRNVTEGPLGMNAAVNLRPDTNEPFLLINPTGETREPREYIDTNWGPLIGLSRPDKSGYKKLYFDNASSTENGGYQHSETDPTGGSRYSFRQVQAWLKGQYGCNAVMEAIPMNIDGVNNGSLQTVDRRYVNDVPCLALTSFLVGDASYYRGDGTGAIPRDGGVAAGDGIKSANGYSGSRPLITYGENDDVSFMMRPTDSISFDFDSTINIDRLFSHYSVEICTLGGQPGTGRYIVRSRYNDGDPRKREWSAVRDNLLPLETSGIRYTCLTDVDTQSIPSGSKIVQYNDNTQLLAVRYTNPQSIFTFIVKDYLDRGYIPCALGAAKTSDGVNEDIGVAVNIMKYLKGELTGAIDNSNIAGSLNPEFDHPVRNGGSASDAIDNNNYPGYSRRLRSSFIDPDVQSQIGYNGKYSIDGKYAFL
jgi:hypothetical protein